MATRTLTYRKWLTEVAKHGFGEGFKHLSGYAVPDVAVRLDMSRQRVHQLLESGALDALQITTKTGTVAMTLVTEASLERYLESRVPVPGHQGHFSFDQTAA